MKISYTLLIAWRYIQGKKTFQAINVITAISTVGIAIGAAALMLILSVFNGFEDLLKGLYNAIYTDLKVYPTEGKFFVPDSSELATIKSWPEVKNFSLTLEETSLIDYKGNQDICTLKGLVLLSSLICGRKRKQPNLKKFSIRVIDLTFKQLD